MAFGSLLAHIIHFYYPRNVHVQYFESEKNIFGSASIPTDIGGVIPSLPLFLLKKLKRERSRAWIKDEFERWVTPTDINYIGQPPVEKLPINKNFSSTSLLFRIHRATPITNRKNKTMLFGPDDARLGLSWDDIIASDVHSACWSLLIFLQSDAKAVAEWQTSTYIHIYFFPSNNTGWSD